MLRTFQMDRMLSHLLYIPKCVVGLQRYNVLVLQCSFTFQMLIVESVEHDAKCILSGLQATSDIARFYYKIINLLRL